MESHTQKINTKTLPPMLRSYLEYKEKYPEALLFFQVGDFYELFFDDAVTASRILNLTLTSRDKSSENPIPMCGMPIAAVESYLEKLVSQGRSVAVVKQVGEAGARKGMMDRELERIITPGVRVLGGESKSKEANYLVAIFVNALGEEFSLAISDVRTGKIFVKEGLDREAFIGEVRSLNPAELVLPREFEGKRFDRRSNWIKELETSTSKNLSLAFWPLEKGDASRFTQIQGYVALAETTKRAVQLLVSYVDETTVGRPLQFVNIDQNSDESDLVMDAGTRSHLELVENSRGGGLHGTLLSVLDETQTVQGSRLLRQWILRPSRNEDQINSRLDVVEYLINSPVLFREEVNGSLKLIADLERLATRLELLAINPRELGALRDSLSAIVNLRRVLTSQTKESSAPSLMEELITELNFDSSILDTLVKTLSDSPPAVLTDSGIIRDGVSTELDRFRDIRKNGKSWIAQLEAEEKEKTGISSLKIRFNNVFGYYIEVTKANLEKVPDSYIRKQTTAQGERYITPELKTQEDEILGAEEKELKIERQLFMELLQELSSKIADLRFLSEAVATSDVLMSLASVAERDNLKRAKFYKDKQLKIIDGKHPVLAQELGHAFVPNTLTIIPAEREVLLITGPNMGGKSTYLRQAALIVIMAQLGSFVPAAEAHIGMVDKIFTRIGATDNMLEGESTFMVEMREAAFILANATESSLLLIDELGRGTATEDGLSIAQATLEWIVQKLGARTLFASHFHELTQLEGMLPGLINLSVGSQEVEGDIIFTHSICEGPASRSYGLEVARIAGLPEHMLERAREIMNQENSGLKQKQNKQLSIFSQAPLVQKIEKTVEPTDYKTLKTMSEKLRLLDLNAMTPLDALNALARLRQDL